MSVVIVNGSNNSGSGGTVTCNLPAAIAPGNLLLAYVFSQSGVSTPAGWTRFIAQTSGSFLELECFWKIADGTEGATVTFPGSVSTWMVCMNKLTGTRFNATCIVNPQSNGSGMDDDAIFAPDPGTAAAGQVRIASGVAINGTNNGNGGSWNALAALAIGTTPNASLMVNRWNGAGGPGGPLIRFGTLSDYNDLVSMSVIIKDVPALSGGPLLVCEV